MAVIEGCDLCVGNDTFGLHAAIAVDTPSVVIMWGGDGDRWIPWKDTEIHRMVREDIKHEDGIHGGFRGITTSKALNEIVDLIDRGMSGKA